MSDCLLIVSKLLENPLILIPVIIGIFLVVIAYSDEDKLSQKEQKIKFAAMVILWLLKIVIVLGIVGLVSFAILKWSWRVVFG